MDTGMAIAREAQGERNDAIRVMIVDDSAVIRGLITKFLEADSRLKVVATSSNGLIATQSIARANPDVVVLDIEMPIMDGITALPKLLAARPGVAIIIASTLSQIGAEVSLQALALGAADYVPKPAASRLGSNEEFRRDLLERVLQLGGRVRARRQSVEGPQRAPVVGRVAPKPAGSAPVVLRKPGTLTPQILAIGSSTGGPQALNTVLKDFPASLKMPIVITQHMPPTFTAILAQHIAKASGWACHEAVEGEIIAPGVIYVAPGDRHLTFERKPTGVIAHLTNDPPENFCRPAVDPMLRSLVRAYGARVFTVVLTGMGSDGLKGAREVIAAGGTVIAQDEPTSVVWGMPGAVTGAGLCAAVLPLPEIARYVVGTFTGRGP